MTSDHFAVRVVVCTLAIATVIGICLTGYLATTGTAIPDQLDRLITLMAGGLLGILSRTSSAGGQNEPPQQVQVVNEGPAEAVPVAENPAPVAGAVKKAR